MPAQGGLKVAMSAADFYEVLDHLQRKIFSDDFGIAHATDWSIVQLWFQGEHIGDIRGQAVLREGVNGTLPDGSTVHLQLHGPSYFADLEVTRNGEIVKKAISKPTALAAVVVAAGFGAAGPLDGSPYTPASRRERLEPRPGVKKDLERAGMRLFICALGQVATGFLLITILHRVAKVLTTGGVKFDERPYIIGICVIFGAIAGMWLILGVLCRFFHSAWAAIIGFLLYLGDIGLTVRYAKYLPAYYFVIKLFGLLVLGRGAMSGIGEHWRRKDARRAARARQD